MDDSLLRLLSIASDSILLPPHESEIRQLVTAGGYGTDLCESLCLKNGWYAFEMSLHAFPLGRREGILDLSLWNSASLWRSDYGSLAHGCFFFAEDVFGVQFCFKNERVQTFDPETGQTQEFATSLGDWAARILEDYQVHTGYPLAHEWQKTHRLLKEGERLLPKVPFVLRGAYALDNLHVLDSVKGMKYRASIAKQLRDVPDGSKVKIRISQ